MSKSKGNTLSPQDVSKQNGSEILRLWVASADYSGDVRFGPGIVQSAVESYRKLRNTMRFLLGNLAHYQPDLRVAYADMPELEHFMLHRLWELDASVRNAYENYDFKRVFSSLFNFCTGDLSALYFDIRKDALYCDPASSLKRRAALTVLDELFGCLTTWLAPILCFTSEEAYLSRFPRRRLRCISKPSQKFRRTGATIRSPPNGRRSGKSGTSSPARLKWSGAKSGSVPAWKRHPSST